MKKINLKKILRTLSFVLLFFLLVILLIPVVFEDKIANEVKKAVNGSITSNLNFDTSEISIFKNFPALTFTFQNVALDGAEPFDEQPMLKAQELGFGIHLLKLLFKQEVYITKTYLKNAQVFLVKDKYGNANYTILKDSEAFEEPKETSANELNLNFNKLKIKNSSFVYRDEANGITISSIGLKFNAKTALDNGRLELGSVLNVDSLDVMYDKIDYLKGKKFRGTSHIVYDTNNLSIDLDENTVSLNDLDLRFDGNFNLFENGLAYDFIFKCQDKPLSSLLSILPPKYLVWASEMKEVSGRVDAQMTMRGFSGTVPNAFQKDRLALALDLRNTKLAHKESNYMLEDLNLKLNAAQLGNEIDLSVDPLRFSINGEQSSGTLVLKGTNDNYYIKSNFKSTVNLTALNKTLKLPDLDFAGQLNSNWQVEGQYQPSQSKFPKTTGKFELSDGYLKLARYPEPIKGIQISGEIANSGNSFSTAELRLNTFNFEFKNNPFKAKVYVKDFDDPTYALSCKGTVDFTSLQDMIDAPILFTSGQMKADFNMVGTLHNASVIPQHKGSLSLTNVFLERPEFGNPIEIQKGNFLFLNQKMAFSDFHLQYGNTKVDLNGYFENYLDFLVYSSGTLKGTMQLDAKRIAIAELLPKQKALIPQSNTNVVADSTAAVSSRAVLQVPDHIDLSLQIAIDTLQYNALKISNLKGLMAVKDQTLILKNSRLEMIDGTASLDGFYKPIQKDKAAFSMDLNADHLNIKKGFGSIVLFQELMPAAEKAAGFISVAYNLSGTLDQEMLPELPSLKGKGSVAVDSIQFADYKLFSSLSKKSGFNALDNPKISEIKIYSEIDNNVLEIERFKYRVKHIRLRTEGQISLDGSLGLKMRIGIPPFGLIGIPVVVKGTHEDFKVKLGKRAPDMKAVDTLGGSFSEADLLRVKMLRDSIKSDMTIQEIDAMQQKIQGLSLDSLRLKSTDSIPIPNQEQE